MVRQQSRTLLVESDDDIDVDFASKVWVEDRKTRSNTNDEEIFQVLISPGPFKETSAWIKKGASGCEDLAQAHQQSLQIPGIWSNVTNHVFADGIGQATTLALLLFSVPMYQEPLNLDEDHLGSKQQVASTGNAMSNDTRYLERASHEDY
ncbi:hypothetical protein O0I10_004427 [Lichtheimia ornata]|uniref:Uncharacterized protein n=1 Tax=Lichtheimia ornata TaxID=688661 RepID=A0AAD7V6I4_9FUNG|nr:uncharacterized protein O0I10_004427 [Lichtheimia ornata]KAJ8659834.1 hypothetical protein O0I10_004427 [Lichtheimia ornata]